MLFSLGTLQALTPQPGFVAVLGLSQAAEGKQLPSTPEMRSWRSLDHGPSLMTFCASTWAVPGQQSGRREFPQDVSVREHKTELPQYKIHLFALGGEWN